MEERAGHRADNHNYSYTNYYLDDRVEHRDFYRPDDDYGSDAADYDSEEYASDGANGYNGDGHGHTDDYSDRLTDMHVDDYANVYDDNDGEYDANYYYEN